MNGHTQNEISEAIAYWESELNSIDEGVLDKIKTGVKNFKANRAKAKEAKKAAAEQEQKDTKDAEKKKFADKKPDQNKASKDLQTVMETEEIGNWPLIVARKIGDDSSWTYHLVTGFKPQHDTDGSDGSTDLYAGYTILMYDSRPVKGNLSDKAQKLAALVKTNIDDSDIKLAEQFEKDYPEIANIIKTERMSTDELPVDSINEYIVGKAKASKTKKLNFDDIKDKCQDYLNIINNSQDFENNAKNGFLFMYDNTNDDIDEFGKRAIAVDTKYQKIMTKGKIIYFIVKCPNADKIEDMFKKDLPGIEPAKRHSSEIKKLKPAIF